MMNEEFHRNLNVPSTLPSTSTEIVCNAGIAQATK